MNVSDFIAILLALLLSVQSTLCQSSICTADFQRGSCFCKLANGSGIYDLTSLATTFQSPGPSGQWIYQISFCRAVATPYTNCKSSAVCQTAKTDPNNRNCNCGDYLSTTFEMRARQTGGPMAPAVVMDSIQDGVKRRTVGFLDCSSSQPSVAMLSDGADVDKDGSFLYYMTLRGSAFCPTFLATTTTTVTTPIPASYAEKIFDYQLNGHGRGQTYAKLRKLVDSVGNRYSKDDYWKAGQLLLHELNKTADRAWTEPVLNVPNWQRSPHDFARLVQPISKPIEILALGGSVSTPSGQPLQAFAIVVRTFEELAAKQNTEVQGQIVVFNEDWQGSYGGTVRYRTNCAIEAAKKGAAAVLVRSITPYSLYTVHTGMTSYDSGIPKIPAAAISMEDAELLQRLQDDGQAPQLKLQIKSGTNGMYDTFNVIAEIKGTEYPDEMVIFGGHLDSWDVGEGALDDGGGVAIAWQTLSLLKELELKPRRTLRAIFWAAEEVGVLGGSAYFLAHRGDINKISLAMESDSGTFKPKGFTYFGNSLAQDMLQSVVDQLAPIDATKIVARPEGGPSDLGQFAASGVPAVELATENDKYFWYHHSNADSLAVINPDDLDACAASIAITAFGVAQLDELLPRPTTTTSSKTTSPSS